MRKNELRIASSILAVLLFAEDLNAQARDWAAVKNLQPGTRVSVKTEQRYPCVLESATDDEIVCKMPQNRLLRLPPRMEIPRGDIHEIRLEHNQAKDGWIGAATGAGVGAAVGAGTGTDSRGAKASFGAVAGAAAGAVLGSMIPIFKHGRIVYKH